MAEENNARKKTLFLFRIIKFVIMINFRDKV